MPCTGRYWSLVKPFTKVGQLIHGARAAALLTKEPGPWRTELKKRRPASVAIVAMANKLARTVWAIAAHGRKYDKNHVSIRPY